MGARGSFRGAGFASPSAVSAVSAWLRVANATSDVNGISSVPDALNTNPAVQSVDARKPVIENSANGLPCMRFVTNDVLRWPITAQSSATNYAGWGFWFKPDNTSLSKRLVIVSPGTNGASATKLLLTATNTARMQPIASADGIGTKSFNSTSSYTTAWQFVTIEYDRDGATDAARLISTVNGVQFTGSFSGAGDISAGLVAATGNILIGNGNDGTASNPYNGLLGPNLYAFASRMPGATLGLLTTAARAFLMNYEAPT